MIDSGSQIRGMQKLPTRGFQSYWVSVISGIIFLGIAVALGATHPRWPTEIMIGAIVCSVFTFVLPSSFPALFVVTLTVADFYPLTGRLTVQEFDPFLCGSISGVLLRWRRVPSDLRSRFDAHGVVWMFFWGSLILGALIGLYRLPNAPWGDELSVYFSGWNVVRIAKGYVFGGVFLFLVSRITRESLGAWKKSFCLGMDIAAFYVGIVVLIERAIYPGLLNFDIVYRAAGPFFTMHIGDHHLDAFLVLAFPYVLSRIQVAMQAKGFFRGSVNLSVALVLTALVAHAAIATMSRATIIVIGLEGLVWSVLVWGTGVGFGGNETASRIGLVRWLFLAVFSIAVVGVMVGSYWMIPAIKTRFDNMSADIETRQSHGEVAIREARSGLGGVILGHGLGTVPSMIASDMGLIWPPLVWRVQDGKGIIEVQGGWRLSLERLGCFDVSKGTLRVRALNGLNGALVCGCVEQSILEVIRDPEQRIDVSGVNSRIMEFPGPVSEGEDDRWPGESIHPLARWRPRVTSFRGIGNGAVIENGTGNVEWISSKSSYPWFFVSKNHMIWRTKNFLSSAYYEQGILGVVGWIALLGSTLWMLFSRWSRKDVRIDGCTRSSAVAVFGFVSIAMVATLIDTPWIVAMFLACLTLLRLDMQCNEIC